MICSFSCWTSDVSSLIGENVEEGVPFEFCIDDFEDGDISNDDSTMVRLFLKAELEVAEEEDAELPFGDRLL